jgi:U3 small nucleolar ribonucleoprotein protein LCP5
LWSAQRAGIDAAGLSLITRLGKRVACDCFNSDTFSLDVRRCVVLESLKWLTRSCVTQILSGSTGAAKLKSRYPCTASKFIFFAPTNTCRDYNNTTNMAVQSTLPALLQTLTQSITAAAEAAKEKVPSLLPPKEGISLLDVKNELFLSYLQNLVFLILLKIRNGRSDSDEEEEDFDGPVIKKLQELSVYIDRGAMSLEKDLKYQIDKVVRAAEDAKIAADRATKAAAPTKKVESSDEEDEGEEDGSDVESEDGGATLQASEINDLQYRPNPSSLVRPSFAGAESDNRKSDDGVYKPPRIQATAMPTTERRDKEARKPNKSATLDEFISTELSTAPMAEPSIGSGIVEGGRRSKSEKEKLDEKERREYEERNYVRLPKESKKDRAKKGGRKDAGYGGEEWRGLGEGIDRIERLTKRSGEGKNLLEKSRKRPTEDGPRGSGMDIAPTLKKRQKVEGSGRKDRGR